MSEDGNLFEDSDMFKEYFEEHLTNIHQWGEPENFAFVIKSINEDKNGDQYLKGHAYYPDNKKGSEIIYPFKSMETQLTKLIGEDTDDWVGEKVIIKYQGKKKNPKKGGKDFHSAYIIRLD